jgi:hypothetical protein
MLPAAAAGMDAAGMDTAAGMHGMDAACMNDMYAACSMRAHVHAAAVICVCSITCNSMYVCVYVQLLCLIISYQLACSRICLLPLMVNKKQ